MKLLCNPALANIRLEQTAGKSRFNVKVCTSPVHNRAAAQAGLYLKNRNKMAPYQSHGFIGKEINTWIKATKKNYKALFDIAEKLNVECYKFIKDVTIDSNSLRKTLISCLFARCLEFFQAIYILVSHGMAPSSNILLRSLIEAVFVLCATSKDDEALEVYIFDGERERLRITRKLLADKDSTLSSDQIEKLKNVEAELVETIKCQTIKKLSTEDFAKKAGLHSWYLTAYAKTSWAVHTTIRDMDQYLAIDKTGKLKSIKFIPTDEESSTILSTSCDVMLISLTEFLTVFGLETAFCDKYAKELISIKEQV